MMTSATTNEPKRIHPHKFTMWVAMGSIVMAFAGLTSAYIVKKNQSSWLEFDLPIVFWYSTVVILVSSLTMHLATKAFKAREMGRYRTLITVTAALGLLFIILQYMGFNDLEARSIALVGPKSNSAASFLFVISSEKALRECTSTTFSSTAVLFASAGAISGRSLAHISRQVI